MAKKKDRGWIKLHRQIQDSAIWNIDESFDRRSAWIDLLLMVNHEDRTIMINGRNQVIGAGQRWTSTRTLASRWGWSKDRVTRYLKLLKSDGMITLERRSDGTLLTIVKYGFFQTGRDTDKDTDKDTGKDTNKDTDKDETRTSKNLKNDNKNTLTRKDLSSGGEWQ